MKKAYFLSAFLLSFVCQLNLQAQCTTEAGTLAPGDLHACFGFLDNVLLDYNEDEVLDSDDIIKYIVHDGSPTTIGPNYQFFNLVNYVDAPDFAEDGVAYQVAVIAGNPDGMGGVDFSDPCLSFNGGVTATWHAPPSIDLPDVEIGCDEYGQELFINIQPPSGDYLIEMDPFQGEEKLVEQTVELTNPDLSTIFYVEDLLSGCRTSDTITVTAEAGKPIVTIEEVSGSSCGALDVVANVEGGQAPYAYEWADGSTSAGRVLEPGTHCVSVTSANGCVAKNCIVVPEPSDIEVDLAFNQSDNCEQSFLEAVVSGAAGNLTYSWSSGDSNEAENFDFAVGENYVTVTDANGCQAVASRFVDEAPAVCGELRLRLFGDFNADCAFSGNDELLPNFKATLTDENGTERLVATLETLNTYNWSRRLDPGDYTLAVHPPNDLWAPCSPTLSFSLAAGEINTVDVPLQPTALCPDLAVNVSTGELTWCAPDNFVSLRYQNFGTEAAADAFVTLQLEEFLSITSAELPFTEIDDHLYRFELGTLDIGEKGSLQLRIAIDCEAEFGATHCLEAEIAPNEPCMMLGGWSGASVDIVDARCEGDNLSFFVENVGTATMTTELEYVIIEDAVMFMQAPQTLPPLAPGEQHEITVPANGATWRLETNQEPNHPGFDSPALAVEGCDFYGSTGFVNQFPQNDEDAFVDIECVQSTGSYDPNDKQGFPLGLGDGRIIAPGQPLEYRIRFQNTGTDTAELVVIRDTLSEWLDPLSLEIGAASHDYRFEAYGKGRNYLAFIFEDINLLDSNLNEPASHGFIDFKVWPEEGTPLGTDIFNRAAIYFDYNPPIITNTTYHRIDSLFTTATEWLSPQPYELRIAPNPVADEALLWVVGLPPGKDLHWQLLDATGRSVWSQRSDNGQATLQRGALPSGLYFLRVSRQGRLVGNGKLIIR